MKDVKYRIVYNTQGPEPVVGLTLKPDNNVVYILMDGEIIGWFTSNGALRLRSVPEFPRETLKLKGIQFNEEGFIKIF